MSAYVVRRPNGKPRVAVWNSITKSQDWLSAQVLKDAGVYEKTDLAIKEWAERRYPSHRKTFNIEAPPSSILSLVDSYQRERSVDAMASGKSIKTINDHVRYLNNYIIPYFCQEEPRQELPTEWYKKSPGLKAFILSRGGSSDLVTKTNSALRKFFQWLRLTYPIRFADMDDPPLRSSATRRVLKFDHLPDPVRFNAGIADSQTYVKLIGILGYFCNLRTQEIYALTPGDFVVGHAAEKLECCVTMKVNGLFNKMAVGVIGQRRQDDPRDGSDGSHAKTKHSRTYVAVWDQEAAKEIAKYLVNWPVDEPLFPKHNDTHRKEWDEDGYKGLCIRDCRKAGLYHLAARTGMKNDKDGLRRHARHKTSRTLEEWYLRIPKGDHKQAPDFSSLLD